MNGLNLSTTPFLTARASPVIDQVPEHVEAFKTHIGRCAKPIKRQVAIFALHREWTANEQGLGAKEVGILDPRRWAVCGIGARNRCGNDPAVIDPDIGPFTDGQRVAREVRCMECS